MTFIKKKDLVISSFNLLFSQKSSENFHGYEMSMTSRFVDGHLKFSQGHAVSRNNNSQRSRKKGATVGKSDPINPMLTWPDYLQGQWPHCPSCANWRSHQEHKYYLQVSSTAARRGLKNGATSGNRTHTVIGFLWTIKRRVYLHKHSRER